MSAQIIIITGPDRGRSFTRALGSTLRIGRSSETTTQLTDPSVSRVHCEIFYDGARALLTNMSDKGTLVNGKRVTQHPLRHGDVARIGGTEFRFALTAMDEAETIMQPLPPR
jgi:pSer/pThr/pTyr-binding forkhead associated (FHA) protein